jgi:Swi5-dependent recombination DNA repair protein 1
MGGPRAWKEIQKKQQEFQNSWDNDPQEPNADDDDDEVAAEKRDLYAEYDVEEETENEKSQRVKGLGDTGEMPGQEDVSISIACYLSHERFLFLFFADDV